MVSKGGHRGPARVAHVNHAGSVRCRAGCSLSGLRFELPDFRHAGTDRSRLGCNADAIVDRDLRIGHDVPYPQPDPNSDTDDRTLSYSHTDLDIDDRALSHSHPDHRALSHSYPDHRALTYSYPDSYTYRNTNHHPNGYAALSFSCSLTICEPITLAALSAFWFCMTTEGYPEPARQLPGMVRDRP